jgi:hypothetical protein
MAKKDAKVNPAKGEGVAPKGDAPENVPAFVDDKPIVKVADLQAARVCVSDDAGNYYFLDPGMRSGEYILRPVPKNA